MKLEISLFSNGSMLSKYSDGRPAYRYSGDWRKLKLLYNDMKSFNTSGLPRNEKVTEIETYFITGKADEMKAIKVEYADLKELIQFIKSK